MSVLSTEPSNVCSMFEKRVAFYLCKYYEGLYVLAGFNGFKMDSANVITFGALFQRHIAGNARVSLCHTPCIYKADAHKGCSKSTHKTERHRKPAMNIKHAFD